MSKNLPLQNKNRTILTTATFFYIAEISLVCFEVSFASMFCPSQGWKTRTGGWSRVRVHTHTLSHAHTHTHVCAPARKKRARASVCPQQLKTKSVLLADFLSVRTTHRSTILLQFTTIINDLLWSSKATYLSEELRFVECWLVERWFLQFQFVESAF